MYLRYFIGIDDEKLNNFLNKINNYGLSKLRNTSVRRTFFNVLERSLFEMFKKKLEKKDYNRILA